MDFKIDGIKSFGCINMETGKSFELSDATIEVDTFSPNQDEIVSLESINNPYRVANFTCENAMINVNLLAKLFMQEKPNTFDIQYTVMVQARRHRKKRINKKWLKRYGYKQQQMISNGWKLGEYNAQTGEVEMVKRNWR